MLNAIQGVKLHAHCYTWSDAYAHYYIWSESLCLMRYKE